MLVALELDDRVDPSIPRIADPELRSRLVGYLGRGWIARPGYRTDGAWVWPESLAERMRLDGVGPDQQLLDHIIDRGVLVPVGVPERVLLAAAAAQPPAGGYVPAPAGYLAATATGSPAPTDLVRITPPAAAGTAVAGGSWLAATGWQAAVGLPVDAGQPALREVTGSAAAELADRLSRDWHGTVRLRAAEATGPVQGPRAARIFDAVTADGRPAFSPNRVRIVEPERRERIVRYLNQGRMVLRATGRMPDPLTDDPTPRVPLTFRTDGVWVWSDAAAYYLDARGVAPELDFLCHLEEQAYLPPTAVDDDVARAAGAVAQRPPAPTPRVAPTYLRAATGELYRHWVTGDWLERLDSGLRWRRCPGDWIGDRPGLVEPGLVEISEADAGLEIDDRWSRTGN